MKERSYIAIDLKSFYASVKCMYERYNDGNKEIFRASF